MEVRGQVLNVEMVQVQVVMLYIFKVWKTVEIQHPRPVPRLWENYNNNSVRGENTATGFCTATSLLAELFHGTTCLATTAYHFGGR